MIDLMHEHGDQAQDSCRSIRPTEIRKRRSPKNIGTLIGNRLLATKNPSTHRSLPFTHFLLRIPTNLSPSQLLTSHKNVYNTPVDAIGTSCPEMLLASGESEVVANVTTLSYNVAMTTSRMAICPTRSEASIIGSRNGSGLIAFDGTLLAGRLLVKTEEECISLRGYRK